MSKDIYMVGDWLGTDDGHVFWSDDRLKKSYLHRRKKLKRSIEYVRQHGWNDTFVECGACDPRFDLQTVKQFKKEVIRRKSYNVYFGVK